MDGIKIALFNLKIEKKTIVSIIGPNASGKTKLLQIIKEKYPNTSELVAKKSENGIVKDIITSQIKNQNLSKNEIKNRVKRVIKKLHLEKVTNVDFNSLNRIEKNKVLLAESIIINPEILLIDNMFTSFSQIEKKEILNYLKKISKYDTTIIYTTFNSEECLYSDKVLVLNNMKNILFDTPINIFTNEKIMKKLNIDIPFAIDLSSKLKDYNIKINITTNIDKMVDELWK